MPVEYLVNSPYNRGGKTNERFAVGIMAKVKQRVFQTKIFLPAAVLPGGY